MGLIFNGNGDVIKAVDGSLTVEGIDLGGSTNINAGIVTGTSANFTGAVSVGGVLTYEDVKNVDSVGIVTARAGLHAKDDSTFYGVTSGRNVVWDKSENSLEFGDYTYAKFGLDEDLTIWSNNTASAINNKTGELRILSGTNVRILKRSDAGLGFAGQVANFNIDGACDFYHNGTKRIETSSTGATVTGDITISDKIIHGGDTNTAIRFPAADTVSVETAGAERLRITSAGALRLSDTASPNDQNADIWVASDVLNFNAYGTNGAFIFKSGSSSTERLRIDSSGRLLLGTTTEGHTSADDLTIATSGHTGITLRSGTSSAGSIYFSDATSGGDEFNGYIIYDQSADSLRFGTNENDRIFITSVGKVFIGSTSDHGPSAYNLANAGLSITAAGENVLRVLDSTSYAADVGGAILIGGNYRSSGDTQPFVELKSFKENGTDTNYAYGFRIGTTPNSGSITERLRITSSGRIGIGTDAPATIDTSGSVDIVTNVANNSPAQFRVLNKHSVYGGGIQVKNNNARGGLEFLTAAGVNNFGIYNTTGGWYWGSTLNIPHGSVLRIGQTSGSALLNIDSQSGVDGHIIATFNGEESGGNHAGLNIAHYLCGSDDNRTGLYWEHQNVSNQRMWMGDDLRLYLKSSDPTESTAQGRYIMTVEGGSADFPDGSSYDNAAKSALEIKKHYPNSQTGNYWIYDYNGTPRQIHCEMEIDGGGWMMWHDHNASNTSMNEALGGSASSPHSGLGRGNYGNYAYYQVLIRATKVGNASREALHTIVQLDHNGNLFRKYDYGEEFFKEEVGNPYNPTLNAYFNSGDGEWIQNTAAYGGQCGSSGWSDFGSGTSTVYIREKDSRLSPGDHRSYAMHERIYCFNDNGVPMWRNSTSMGVLPYWTDIRGAAGADGSGLNSSGTQTDNLQDNGRTLYSNNGNNGDFLHGRIHGVFLGEFEIAFKLAYWWGWAHGNMNAGIGVAEVIRDSQAWPYSNSSSIQYAGFGLNNNSSNNKWYPMHHYNGDTSTTIGNSGSGYTGGNSGFNIMWRESDGTIKVRRQDNTHGTYTYGKFVGPLVFGNGTQSPMFTEVGLCWDKPWNNNGNCMR